MGGGGGGGWFAFFKMGRFLELVNQWNNHNQVKNSIHLLSFTDQAYCSVP